MVACELSVAMPHSGGYIVWVNSAFGPMASLLNGLANFLCNIFDCALYPLLLTEYLKRALLPLLPPEPHGGGGASWWRYAPDVLGTVLRLLLVPCRRHKRPRRECCWHCRRCVDACRVRTVRLARRRGVPLADRTPLRALHALIAKLADLVLPGLLSDQLDPLEHLRIRLGGDGRRRGCRQQGDLPARLNPRLGLNDRSLPIPLAACSSSDFNWRQWGEGQFENLGIEFGGSLLGGALLLSSIVSMVGVMCTLVMTSSRAIAAMAQLRMLPPALARLHPVTGAPHLAVLLNAALIAFATVTLRFEALLELSVFFYAINAIMQCAAVLRLRSTHPHRVRPRTILPAKLLLVPVGIAVLTLLLSPMGNWLAALGLLVRR